MSKLVLAEKPSVTQSIAKVLGANISLIILIILIDGTSSAWYNEIVEHDTSR